MLSPLRRLRSPIARALLRVRSLDLAGGLAVILIGLGALALVNAIRGQHFDYDELEHFHAAWLVRMGSTPFTQFFECHPPFIWYPLSLFFRVFGDSYNLLFVFRFIAALGQVAFMVGVLKNVALTLRQLPRPVALPAGIAALAAAFIVLHPAIFEYLFEFRIDSWPNALLVIAIYRYRTRRQEAFRSSIELAALSMAAVLCSPKLIVLAATFALVSIVVDERRLVRAAGMLAGGAGALALGAGLLLLAGMNPVDVYRLSLRYHHVLNTKGGFENGLYDMVWGHSARKVVIASAIAFLLVARRRFHRAGFEIAVAVFLAVQLELVGFWYKQYYAPWYLLAIVFLPYLEVLARRIKPAHALLLAIAILYTGDNAVAVYDSYKDQHEAAADIQARKDMEALVPPGGRIVATLFKMPLFRRSVFYQVANSHAPSGFDGAHVMQELKVDPYSQKFTVERARAEIEAGRPDLIMLNADLPEFQRRALDEYVARHEAEYTRQAGALGAVLVRKR